jgi:DNA-binding GntR family transcriptional regulator
MDLAALSKGILYQGAGTIGQKVETLLRLAIMRGVIKPGDDLSTSKLAADLQVSRMPVREALKKLESEGIVKIQPQKGVRILPVSPEDLRELADIRVALECMAIKFSLSNLTDTDFKAMDSLIDDMAKERDNVQIFDLAEKFHDILYGASNNTRLIELINQTRYKFNLYLWIYAVTFKNVEEIHRILLEAIKSGDEGKATLAIEEHIRQTTRKVMRVINKK